MAEHRVEPAPAGSALYLSRCGLTRPVSLEAGQREESVAEYVLKPGALTGPAELEVTFTLVPVEMPAARR
jgi:hypothetical protein